MSNSDLHAPDADNPFDSTEHTNIRSITDSGMPLHMFPLSTLPTVRAKRKQVKNACTNCQKACKKCDECRPCLRCVKYGHPDQCKDSQRKERKKGAKRGKYRKRYGRKERSVESSNGPFVDTPLATSSGQSASAENPPTGETYPMYPTIYYQVQETSSTALSGEPSEYVSQQMHDNPQRLYAQASNYPTGISMFQYESQQLPYMSHPQPHLLAPQHVSFYDSYAKPPTSATGSQGRMELQWHNTCLSQL